MEGLIRYQAIAVAERIRGGKKMKLQTVWTRIVLVVYLVVVVGASVYVPSYVPIEASFNRRSPAYRWVWNLTTELTVSGSQNDIGSVVDYGRVALEVVSLTAIAGALLIIGSFVGGRKREDNATA